MPRTTSAPAHQLLHHIGFRDWIASRAGFYAMPDITGLVCVALDRGGPLRVTASLTGEPLALTIIDVLTTGQYVTGLDTARTIAAVPLATLRKRRNARRLALETTLQRTRLLPYWLEWVRSAAAAPNAVFGLDLWALRHVRRATFDELAFMATCTPAIGPRMLWALVHADAGLAVTLFLKWVMDGEQARLDGLGDSLTQMVTASAKTEHHAQYLLLVEMLGLVTTEGAG